MAIWKTPFTLDDVKNQRKETLAGHLGIEFIEIGEDYLRGRMPVDYRTIQPMGILHGGASCVLAETLGSIGAYYCLDTQKQVCVGLDLNINHIKSVKEGFVIGTARPLHIGRSTQVWEIRLENEKGDLVAISRLTVAVIERPKTA